jgi:hypothetical protein
MGRQAWTKRKRKRGRRYLPEEGEEGAGERKRKIG